MAFTYKHGDRPLDGFEIQRGVGRGGFGEVYYAVSDGGREVALKYLREHPEVELRGISQCINLKSPHLVSIFDVKQNADGEYFVIMEYVSGPSLRDMLIAEPKGLGPQKAAFFVREIGKGLSYLHGRGIVHRDLKPGNIFYEDGYVKICDYGLSKFISISRHSAQTSSVGTVHYMAPEVGSGSYTKCIDIYAVGVILYEMLLGRVPYDGASMGEILMKHLTQQPEVDGLAQPFAGVIRKCLAKDPKDRYQDVDEIVEALFDVEDVRKSVLGFEPASLTMIAARTAEEMRPSPVPSDYLSPPKPAPFDRRPRNQGADAFSRRFVERTARLDARQTRKERRNAARRQKKAEPKKNSEKETRNVELLGKDHSEEQHIIRSPYRLKFGRRLARLFAAVLVAGGLSAGIGLISESPDLAAVSLAIIMTAVVGIGIGNRVAMWMGPDHPALIGRLMTVIFALPAVGLLYGLVIEEGVGKEALGHFSNELYIPFLLALGIFNWRERIADGLRADFGFWQELFYAFMVFVGVHAITDHATDDAAIWLGAIVGCISLVLRCFSWALIRNPLPIAGIAADGPHGVGSPEDSSARTLPEDEGLGEALGGVAADRELPVQHQRLDDCCDVPTGGRREKVQLPRRYLRPKWMRIGAGIMMVPAAIGLAALIAALGVGEFRHHEEVMGAIVAIVALSLLLLFMLGKVRRVKRVGLWSDWFNPLLRIPAGVLLATGITGLNLPGIDFWQQFGFIVLIVVSSICVLLLLGFRRGSYRREFARQGRRFKADTASESGAVSVSAEASDEVQAVNKSRSGLHAESSEPAGTANDFILPPRRMNAAAMCRSQGWWCSGLFVALCCLVACFSGFDNSWFIFSIVACAVVCSMSARRFGR